MGAFSGPETADDGIVLVLDAQNPLSVGNTSLNVWEDLLSSTTTVSSVGVITCLSVDTASSNFFGAKYSSCVVSGSAVWDNRPPSVSDMNTILETFLDCKSYQTGTYNHAGAVFGGYGAVGNVCTLRFTGFGVGAVIGVGGYFNHTTRQCRLTGDLVNSPVTITSPSGGFADPIVLTSDPADIQFANPGGSGDPMYVYWLGPYHQVPYNTLRSNFGSLTNGPIFTQEPKLEPFGGAGAVYFDGTGDYLELADSDDFNIGSGDFTIEFWVNPGTTSRQTLFTQMNSAGQSVSSPFYSEINSSAQWRFFIASGSTNYEINAGTVTANVWTHLAYVRNGNTTTLYVNGVSVGTADVTGVTANNSSEVVSIGRYPGGLNFTGYISNLRLIKGTALYTSNFTPKRQPLLPESAPNTVLLTCQKGTIRDRSSSAHAITVNGDAKSISGASYFEFDGTNDYIDLGDNYDDIIAGADKKFSMEIWINPDTVSVSNQHLISKHGDSNFSENNREFYIKLSNDEIVCGATFNPSTANMRQYATSSANLTAGSWHHIVLVYDGSIDAAGRFTFYVNGKNEAATETYTNGSWGDIQDTAARLAIGAMVGANVANSPLAPYNGKVSNFKIYSRLLTAAEVKQNYRNTKGRYGL